MASKPRRPPDARAALGSGAWGLSHPLDVDRARELLETAKLQNLWDRMLSAAQVHATLAVEAAVRELIATINGSENAPTRPCGHPS